MQDNILSLNPGAPEVLNCLSPTSDQWFLKMGFSMIQTLAMTDHLQSQAAVLGSGWYRQLMTSNTEKVVTGRIQLSTPAPVQGRG